MRPIEIRMPSTRREGSRSAESNCSSQISILSCEKGNELATAFDNLHESGKHQRTSPRRRKNNCGVRIERNPPAGSCCGGAKIQRRESYQVETPGKMIASITHSITNSTFLMDIINLFPSHPVFWVGSASGDGIANGRVLRIVRSRARFGSIGRIPAAFTPGSNSADRGNLKQRKASAFSSGSGPGGKASEYI